MFFTEFPTNLDTDDNLLKTTDRAFNTLKNPINAFDLTLELNDASKFPLGAQILTIENELIACSSRIGNVFNISQRGFNYTVASAHAANTKVSLNFTSHHWNNIIDAIKNLQSFVFSLEQISEEQTEILPSETKIIKTIDLIDFTDIDFKVKIIDNNTKDISKFDLRIIKNLSNFYNIIYGKIGTIPENDLVLNITNDATKIYLNLTNLRPNTITVFLTKN